MQEAEYESMMVACNAMKDLPGKRKGKRGNPLIGFATTESGSDQRARPMAGGPGKEKSKAKKPRAKKASNQTKPNGQRLAAKEQRAAATARA